MKKRLCILYLTLCIVSTMYANGITKNEQTAQEEVAEIVIESPMIKSSADGVTFSVNENRTYQFGIYSITGQLIKSVKVLPHTSTTIILPKGYYIVKCDKWAKQVVVR